MPGALGLLHCIKGDYRPPFNPPPLRVRALMVERRSPYCQRFRGSGIPVAASRSLSRVAEVGSPRAREETATLLPMVIGLLTLELHFPGARSLKDKRQA